MVGYIPGIDQYTLDYTSFIPYLTQVIQTQDRELQEQKETNLRQEETILHQGETISNQEDRIEELTDRVAEMERILSGLLSQKGSGPLPKNSDPAMGEGAKLYQNLPNPFSESTVISYELPEQVKTAKLVIHSVEGKQMKTYPLSRNAGLGQFTVDAGFFQPGTYTYSLVLDGRVIDTQRMIITE